MTTRDESPCYARAPIDIERAGGHDSGHGMRPWLARVFDVTPRAVAKWYNQGFPPYVLRCFDLLDKIPRHRWPAIWDSYYESGEKLIEEWEEVVAYTFARHKAATT